MGTQLYDRAGIDLDRCPEELSLSDPELVKAIHLDYIRAGAEVIETNTYGANRIRLAAYGLAAQVAGINEAAAQIARDARALTGQRVWIAGSVGPLGRPLSPLGHLTAWQARLIFREQVEALAEAGVDLIILETFKDLREITEAVVAVRDVCELPVVAQMSFDEEAKSQAGDTPADVVETLEELGADVIGANCSTGPDDMLRVVEEMAATARTPISAQPNAGFPSLATGRLIYHSSSEYMAQLARRMVEAGASAVGGCCGTTPEHTATIRDALKGVRVSRGAPRSQAPATRPRAARLAPLVAEPTRMSRELGRGFVVTVEADPPRGFDISASLDSLSDLRASGLVDAISVADSPRAQGRMSALAMCSLIQTRLGTETVLHLALRHRNLVALHSELLGAHALGVRNLLIVRGDLPRSGDYPDATAISDITSSGLIRLVKAFNAGTDLSGKPVEQATSFVVGCALNLGAEDIDRELRALERKLKAGADFIYTQPVYSPEVVENVHQRMGGLPVPLLVGVLPLRSHQHAEFLHNEVPGIVIPAGVMERLRQAGDGAGEAGIQICRELLSEVRSMVGGAYVMPPFGRYDLVPRVLEGIKQRSST